MTDLAALVGGALSGGHFLALPLVFLGGVVAGLNPCCIALYPAAATTCCAVSACCGEKDRRARPLVRIALAFVAGIAVVTAGLGVVAALAGGVIAGLGRGAYYAIAVLPLAMSFHVFGWVRLPLPRPGALSVTRSIAGVFVAGAAFSVVLAPCGTPILAAVLAWAAVRGSVVYGGMLLFAYGLGTGTPIFLAAFAADGLLNRLAESRWQSRVNYVAGAGLLAFGLYLVWIA